jgi:purine-binding chemotaxis protein CheW
MEKKMDNRKQTSHYLLFTLAGKQFALPLDTVLRVVHAVEITALPKAPEIVRGLVNYKGQILPVIDISRRFHLPERENHPDRYFIIVHTQSQKFGLLSDNVSGVREESPDNIVTTTEITAGVEFLAGVLKIETGMTLIPDMDKILTHEEEIALKEAVRKGKEKNKDAGR